MIVKPRVAQWEGQAHFAKVEEGVFVSLVILMVLVVLAFAAKKLFLWARRRRRS